MKLGTGGFYQPMLPYMCKQICLGISVAVPRQDSMSLARANSTRMATNLSVLMFRVQQVLIYIMLGRLKRAGVLIGPQHIILLQPPSYSHVFLWDIAFNSAGFTVPL